MAVWRWDTGHFTLDDSDQHKFDGWHNHNLGTGTGGSVRGGDYGGVNVGRELKRRRLKDEDDLILRIIKMWTKRQS